VPLPLESSALTRQEASPISFRVKNFAEAGEYKKKNREAERIACLIVSPTLKEFFIPMRNIPLSA